MTSRRGVTLIELLIVVALISLMVGITFPSVTAGVESLRISAATASVVSFLNGALNRASRLQEVVEIEISLADSTLRVRSSRPGYKRQLKLPKGVTIRSLVPPVPMDRDIPRRFLVFPAGTVPRIGIELVNRRGVRRIIRVDPVTGAPRIEKVGLE